MVSFVTCRARAQCSKPSHYQPPPATLHHQDKMHLLCSNGALINSIALSRPSPESHTTDLYPHSYWEPISSTSKSQAYQRSANRDTEPLQATQGPRPHSPHTLNTCGTDTLRRTFFRTGSLVASLHRCIYAPPTLAHELKHTSPPTNPPHLQPR